MIKLLKERNANVDLCVSVHILNLLAHDLYGKTL